MRFPTPAHALEDVERTQVELDMLYGELSASAGEPIVDVLLTVLRAADDIVAESRRLAVSIQAK